MITGNLGYPNRFKRQKRKFFMGDKRLRFVEGKQREFLGEVIRNHFSTQAALGRFLGFHKQTIRGWLIEKSNLPKSVFQQLIQLYPSYSCFETFIEEELSWNWLGLKAVR